MNIDINKTMINLKNNNIDSSLVQNKEELISTVKELVSENSSIYTGGSTTLFETGIIDFFRNSNKYNFYDRYGNEVSTIEKDKMNIDAFNGDYFFCSANAITETGEIYQVDNLGNRLAATIFGPKKVMLIVGTNKIVPSVKDAIIRVKSLAAPQNSFRHGNDTYCSKHGRCFQCRGDENSLMAVPSGSCPDTICSTAAVLSKQLIKGRIHIIFINHKYGY